MTNHDQGTKAQSGIFTRILLAIASVDEETLNQCPPSDWGHVRASAALFIAVWVYQTGLFTLVAQNLFAHDGAFHPLLMVAGMFLATFILLLDSYVFNRANFHREGLRELRRGGLDLGGGFFASVRALFFLTVRIVVLSLPIAQLCAIFVGLVVFQADIAADRETRFEQANAGLITAARTHADAAIAVARTDVANADGHVQMLQKQLTVMRQGGVDALATDPAFAAQEDILHHLMAEKSKRDAELEGAQHFASAEMAGNKLEAGNSGIPGRGPVRRAAEERVAQATAADREAQTNINAAQARLDAIRLQRTPASGDIAARSRQMLPQLERDLAHETMMRDQARKELNTLVANREQAIRAEVEGSPDCKRDSTGFIGQLQSLRRIARDPEIAIVIILIDIVSFGFELAAVLAKVTSYIPTEYAARLVRDGFLRTARLARETSEELGPDPDDPPGTAFPVHDVPPPDFGPFPGLGQDATPDPQPDAKPSPDSSGTESEVPETLPTEFMPPKRGRGRPRKHPPKAA